MTRSVGLDTVDKTRVEALVPVLETTTPHLDDDPHRVTDATGAGEIMNATGKTHV